MKEPVEIYKALLEQGVLVRRQDHLIEGCLRASIGTPRENDMFLAALGHISMRSRAHLSNH